MKLKNMIAPVVALAASAGALDWWLTNRGGNIEATVEGQSDVWRWREHDINYMAAGEGQPIVLLHAIYPGASSEQWEQNFNILAKKFRVFAPDLLGFGRSSRPPMNYRHVLYKDLIQDFLKEVVKEPAMMVASGQTAACAIEAAAAAPKQVTRLILCSPTGLERFSERIPIAQQLMYGFWSLPVVGDLAYFSMTSKRSIAWQLKTHTVVDPSVVTPSMIKNIYKQAHQPGAKWAPVSMFGGHFNVNVKAPYAKLTQPILVVWGEMPSYIPISDAEEFLKLNENAVMKTFPDGRLMPEFEHPPKFNALVESWAEGQVAA